MEKGVCDIKGKNYKIINKKVIVDGTDGIISIDVEAPLVAKNAKAGQFVITHASETSERIPLTIADYDRRQGIIKLIFQMVGKSTRELGKLKEGEYILDLLGPLGVPVEIKKYEKPVICIGGGIGIAPVYPKVKELVKIGNYVITIIGSRTRKLLILEDELRKISSELYITTDDGSYGVKGFVTAILKEKLKELKGNVQEIIAIGPIPMMSAVVKEVAGKKYNESFQPDKDYKDSYIKTIVSLNPIMVDGTGMCGGCRVNIWNPEKKRYEPKFTCVNGPAFDGHMVDFDTLIRRNKQYINQEKVVKENGENTA